MSSRLALVLKDALHSAESTAPGRLSQAEVVRRMQSRGADVTYNQVNNWFRGIGRPDAADVPPLVAALDMGPDATRELLEVLGLTDLAALGIHVAQAASFPAA